MNKNILVLEAPSFKVKTSDGIWAENLLAFFYFSTITLVKVLGCFQQCVAHGLRQLKSHQLSANRLAPVSSDMRVNVCLNFILVNFTCCQGMF